MLRKRFRVPHAARQIQNVAAVNMQPDGRYVADALRNMRGVRKHRQDRAARQRHLARFAQLAALISIERIFFFAGQQQIVAHAP